jgi:hypothetical protein
MAEIMIRRGVLVGAYGSSHEVSVSSMVLIATAKGPLGFSRSLMFCFAILKVGLRRASKSH